jgi:protein-S-isoprenylcysteine O-methyltransferase Ste14
MTLTGFLVLLGWIPATGFLFFHARAMVRAKKRNWAGWAVLVMAVVVFISMTLSLSRWTFESPVPDWVRGISFLLILIGLWWKFITILRYEYGNRAPSDEVIDTGEPEREDAR